MPEYFGLTKTKRPAGAGGNRAEPAGSRKQDHPQSANTDNRIAKSPEPPCPIQGQRTGQDGQIKAVAEPHALTQRSLAFTIPFFVFVLTMFNTVAGWCAISEAAVRMIRAPRTCLTVNNGIISTTHIIPQMNRDGGRTAIVKYRYNLIDGVNICVLVRNTTNGVLVHKCRCLGSKS